MMALGGKCDKEKVDIIKEQSLLFDLYKAFDQFESSQKSHIFYSKRPIFLHACASCYKLPSNIGIMTPTQLFLDNLHVEPHLLFYSPEQNLKYRELLTSWSYCERVQEICFSNSAKNSFTVLPLNTPLPNLHTQNLRFMDYKILE